MKTNSLVFQIKRQAWARPCLAAIGRRGPRSSVASGFASQRQAIGGYNSRLQIAAGILRGGRRIPATWRTMNRSFQRASAWSAVNVWLRTGVLRFGSAQSSASMNGLGTLRTVNR